MSMFKERMKKILYSVILLALASCSSEHESPALELNISRGNLTVAEIAGLSVEIGVRNGLSASVKDPDHMAVLNQDIPAAFIWLNNGTKPAVTVSTLIQNDPIQVWFYSSGLPDESEIKNIAQDFEKSFERIKHNKQGQADSKLRLP